MLKFVSFDSNIVQFFGACILEGCPVLVLECMKVRNSPGAFHVSGSSRKQRP